jgi:hypothetical protein
MSTFRFNIFDTEEKKPTVKTPNRFTNFVEAIPKATPVNKSAFTSFTEKFFPKVTPQTTEVPSLIKDVVSNQKQVYKDTGKAFESFDKKRAEIVDPIITKPLEKVAQKVWDLPKKIGEDPTIVKSAVELGKRSSGTGIKAMVRSAGSPETFDQAYKALRKEQAGDPSVWNKFKTQLLDTIPQTAIGLALNFVPGGPAFSTAYWAGLSASEQAEKQGKITDIAPIAIDVAGDKMLGGAIEGLFKAPAKTLWQAIKKSFTTEGGTEVAQDLLKMQVAYQKAKTPEEKAKILASAKEYFTSGQILMTGLVGGLTGAGLGGAVHMGKGGTELYQSMTPEERQAGFAKVPFSGEVPIQSPDPIPEVPPEVSMAETIPNIPEEQISSEPISEEQSLEQTLGEEYRPEDFDYSDSQLFPRPDTPQEQKVHIIDRIFRTPRRVFAKMGLIEPFIKVKKAIERYQMEMPQNLARVQGWKKRMDAISPDTNQRVFKALDGQKVELTEQEAVLRDEIKAEFEYWADRLKIPKDMRITNYITHLFKTGVKGEIPEEIAFLINDKIPKSVYNQFLLERMGAQGYKEDAIGALDAYIRKATRKVHMDPALKAMEKVTAHGQITDQSQLRYITNFMHRLNMRPSDLDIAVDNFIKSTIGYRLGTNPTARISLTLRRMLSRSKIGGSIVSFAKNLTQGVNTFTELGPTYTAIGYKDFATRGTKELNDNGVLLNPIIDESTENGMKKRAIEKVDKLLFLNMTASEAVNRGAAYFGGKAKFLAGKITPKEYKLAFGKDMKEGYKPNLRDAVAYGKYAAEKTQFVFGDADTPIGMSSNTAKLAFQFQTFAVKQVEFGVEMINDREWAKLLRYMFSTMMLFGLVGKAFGMSWEDGFNFKLGAPPAWKFVKDLWDAAWGNPDSYGKIPSAEKRLSNAGKSLFTNVIPGGAQIKRSYEGYQAVKAGYSESAAGNYQYQIQKTPENYIRGTLFGKQNLEEAKKYEKKRSGASKGKSTSLRFKKY